MNDFSNNMRPVIVNCNGRILNGYFHQFVSNVSDNYSITLALVEHMDGSLNYYDPYCIRFSDRERKNGI